MSYLNFTAVDIQTALDAIAVAIKHLPEENPLLIDRFNGLARRLISHQLYFSSGELRNICIGLELLLKDSPMNWNASRLLAYLSPICNYTNQDF